jgi:diaminohydroxyphosphoribosylaminopyrimidine deaminase/5-amino-6-(5-phosphoribosylamino)uracil reductase
LLEAGIARVVAGTRDPSEHGGGAALLKSRGVDVTVSGDASARELIESFARAAASRRPYIALKMAMSLDGAVAARPGVREQLTGNRTASYVRDLRAACDAVMVGANTVRVDDPQLTVRPPRHRARPYRRVVACESEPIAKTSRVLGDEPGYDRTIVLAPGGRRDRFDALRETADVVYVGELDALQLDPIAALEALRARDIYSILCEGGPKLAAALIAAEAVDRFYWAIAPALLGNEHAVPVLSGSDLTRTKLRPRFDRIERLGADLMVGGTFERV